MKKKDDNAPAATGAKKTRKAPSRRPASRLWTSKKLATKIARLADEKQAGRIVVLDVAQALQVADYFVVCDGQNGRHLHHIAEHIARELKKDGIYRMGGSPAPDDSWVLLDFGPVVLHCFSPKARSFYDLENLWGDCRKVRWQTSKKKVAAPEAVLPPEDEDDLPLPTPRGEE
jgi:ribosome-associated protein